MTVKLSDRMSALAALVTPGVRLADVGTDHGYIPVYLCQAGVIPRAIAMDVNSGPLQRAEAHVLEYGLGDRIQLRLSDGVEKLLPGEVDCILIAGMGGGLIQRILTKGEKILEQNPELILQPQSEIPATRRFLREHGYDIFAEDMVEEDGKFYFLMKAHRVEEKKELMVPQILADEFGPLLLSQKHPVLERFLKREQAIHREIREGLERRNVTADDPKYEKIHRRLDEIREKEWLLSEGLKYFQVNSSHGGL